MNEKTKIKNLPGKVLASIAALFLFFLGMSACQSINNRNISTVMHTSWIDFKRETLDFFVDYGLFTKDGVETRFVFLEKDSYVQCTFFEGDLSLLELNHLNGTEGETLFCVTQNSYFYEII